MAETANTTSTNYFGYLNWHQIYN